jgi:hypothetical protein
MNHETLAHKKDLLELPTRNASAKLSGIRCFPTSLPFDAYTDFSDFPVARFLKNSLRLTPLERAASPIEAAH